MTASINNIKKSGHAWLDAAAIEALLRSARPDPALVREILDKAITLKGLTPDEVAVLMRIESPDLLGELYNTAKRVKETIYGKRIVLFAPLYISNFCRNECLYCAFRVSNKSLVRRTLSYDEIASETRAMIRTGQKRIVMLLGEAYPEEGFDYVLNAIRTVYDTKEGPGEIRRINMEIAPLSVEDFRRLKAAGIGTYITFQETYHKATYEQVHRAGRKKDFAWRLECMDRAMEAGIDDVGLGVLFGLADWRFELLALMRHARHLESRFGCGPHTISVPRIEPACGSELSTNPPNAVSDADFKKIIAIIRLAVPYTGMILSTRERAGMRRDCLQLGISQISAGSRTDPGGYESENESSAQFSLGDHRSLDEVVRDLSEMGFIPSFCTACYRMGRTGRDFMDLAKPGEIKNHCDPNAISTFAEYLLDFASRRTCIAGRKLIEELLTRMDNDHKRSTLQLLNRVKEGKRDMFV
ncbi:MAG TPA: [FeFe] hydrogenase H-cluster radical SAM maturase HydG [Terriglobia bacterium]|nr:[FeFe] hydrogenase H-cluster radical SAM maturase HydG [Terriglobia bacterium]